MMDAHDTNQPLNQGELEEEKKTVEVSEAITETPAEDVTAEVQPEAAPKPATKEDVLNQLKELAQDAENANKQDIDNLKQSFYKLHNAELVIISLTGLITADIRVARLFKSSRTELSNRAMSFRAS